MVNRSRRRHIVVALALLSFGGVAACSSDSTSSTSVAATAPEEHIADDAAVVAGLHNMVETASAIETSVAAGSSVDDAQDQLEVDWQQVEGTVRQNEPDTYLRIEDDLGGLDTSARDGDSAETTRFSSDLAAAIADYLTKHP
jgi:hypothetical protein